MKIKLKTKLGFGVLDLGQNAFLNMVGFYFLFFMTDVVKISPVLAGLVLLIGKVWDAVTDPVVGHWSDRTIHPRGRRRPFIFFGSLSIPVFIIAMFTVPAIPSEIGRFLYLSLFYVLASTSFTLMNIPYQALVPELTEDFDQRTSLTAWRMAFAVLGTFLGAGIVGPLAEAFPKVGWSLASVVVGLSAGITGIIMVVTIKEPAHDTQEEGKSLFASIVHVLSRKPFLQAVIPWTLFNLAITVVQGSLVYFFAYILGNQGFFNFGVFALLGFALLAIPLYVKLSHKLDKKGSYITGMLWLLSFLFIFTFIAPMLPLSGSIILMALAGIGLGAHYVMPHSLLPDVIEWDAVTTNTRREGIFASLWTFSVKIGQALALGLTGLVLDISGYKPNTVQEPSAILGITLLTSVIPAFIIILGILVLRRYPINRAFYTEYVLGRGDEEG